MCEDEGRGCTLRLCIVHMKTPFASCCAYARWFRCACSLDLERLPTIVFAAYFRAEISSLVGWLVG